MGLARVGWYGACEHAGALPMADAPNTAASTRLDDDAINAKLEQFPQWARAGEVLQRTFSFRDFLAAMAFVELVAAVAQRQGHHPDILIRYSKVTLTLSTHDAGGLTERDFTLATSINAIGEAGSVV
jgi:4a-hydroxytetrahydrobiopterin dehydratase